MFFGGHEIGEQEDCLHCLIQPPNQDLRIQNLQNQFNKFTRHFGEEESNYQKILHFLDDIRMVINQWLDHPQHAETAKTLLVELLEAHMISFLNTLLSKFSQQIQQQQPYNATFSNQQHQQQEEADASSTPMIHPSTTSTSSSSSNHHQQHLPYNNDKNNFNLIRYRFILFALEILTKMIQHFGVTASTQHHFVSVCQNHSTLVTGFCSLVDYWTTSSTTTSSTAAAAAAAAGTAAPESLLAMQMLLQYVQLFIAMFYKLQYPFDSLTAHRFDVLVKYLFIALHGIQVKQHDGYQQLQQPLPSTNNAAESPTATPAASSATGSAAQQQQQQLKHVLELESKLTDSLALNSFQMIQTVVLFFHSDRSVVSYFEHNAAYYLNVMKWYLFQFDFDSELTKLSCHNQILFLIAYLVNPSDNYIPLFYSSPSTSGGSKSPTNYHLSISQACLKALGQDLIKAFVQFRKSKPFQDIKHEDEGVMSKLPQDALLRLQNEQYLSGIMASFSELQQGLERFQEADDLNSSISPEEEEVFHEQWIQILFQNEEHDKLRRAAKQMDSQLEKGYYDCGGGAHSKQFKVVFLEASLRENATIVLSNYYRHLQVHTSASEVMNKVKRWALILGTHLKDQTNQHDFAKLHDYLACKWKYTIALRLLLPFDEREAMNVLSNRANCALRLHQYEQVARDAHFVLSKFPSHEKCNKFYQFAQSKLPPADTSIISSNAASNQLPQGGAPPPQASSKESIQKKKQKINPTLLSFELDQEDL